MSYNEILKICNWLNFDTFNKVFKGSMGFIQNGYDENNDAVNKIIEVALKNDKMAIVEFILLHDQHHRTSGSS